MSDYSEQVASWYFRLNGYLTTTNFVLHPDMGTVQRTDVDIVCVRFPWRRETAGKELIDEKWVRSLGQTLSVVIAEVKEGQCKLNGPTRDPERENLQRVLRALGTFQDQDVDAVAKALYSRGRWQNQSGGCHCCVCLCCIGSSQNHQLAVGFPECQQITWGEIAMFIHHRFMCHMDHKKQHQQWDDVGNHLWKLATTLSFADFEEKLFAELKTGRPMS